MGKVLVGWACLFAVAAWGTDVDRSRQVVILGVDGMDPALLQQFLDEGRMPNFSELMDRGDFSPLETSVVPQSPVAWSAFITGMTSSPLISGKTSLPSFCTALSQNTLFRIVTGRVLSSFLIHDGSSFFPKCTS